MATNLRQYTDLRTLLDSLEIGALRFYLNGKGMSPSQKYRYLNDMLTPIIDEVWHQQQATNKLVVETECPPGYYDCDGCCVPYKCPELGLSAARKKTKATKRKS